MGGCRDFYGPFPQSLVMSKAQPRHAVSRCAHHVHDVDPLRSVLEQQSAQELDHAGRPLHDDVGQLDQVRLLL
jgi:hypothetical protein